VALAQVNIGRARGAMIRPVKQGFFARLAIAIPA